MIHFRDLPRQHQHLMPGEQQARVREEFPDFVRHSLLRFWQPGEKIPG
jgi:hypothetical protein